jgi:uncharacterized BrkB/YihY/UPF0761 family membrane protein
VNKAGGRTRVHAAHIYASDRTGISSHKETHMSSLVRSIKKFFNDDMSVCAAALSYQLLISIFPFMIFLLALLGLLNITELFDWLLKQAQTILPGRASDLGHEYSGADPQRSRWGSLLWSHRWPMVGLLGG